MRAILPIALLLLAAPTLAQEKLSVVNVDVRTVLAFKAPDAAIQKLLPAGWDVNSRRRVPRRGPT